MRAIVAGTLLTCLAAGASVAGTASEPAVRQAATRYAESFLQGDPSGMEAAIHPAIVRRGVVHSRKSGESFLMNANAETILNDVGEGKIKLPEGREGLSVEVLDVSEDVAGACVSTAMFHDYLILVRNGDAWRVAAALWTPPMKSQVSSLNSEYEQVKRTVEDMIRACLSHDTEGLTRLVHPAVSRRVVSQAEGEGICALLDLDARAFLEASARSSGGALSPEVTVLEVYGDIASVRVGLDDAVDYVQLVKQEGRWMALNCVAAPRGGSSLRAAR